MEEAKELADKEMKKLKDELKETFETNERLREESELQDDRIRELKE